ncbi:MAG: cytochrome c [Terrimicrobiaceae bacterium]|nr:cytochrome c [Terrimicrobiaceae bacterium]
MIRQTDTKWNESESRAEPRGKFLLPQVVAACLTLAGCQPTAPPPGAQTAIAVEGSEIYGIHCAMCHLDGTGSPAAPALRGSALVANDPPAVIRTILHGRRGESMVDGQRFNGIMPAQDYLTDEEIAAVTAYIVREFGGQINEVSAAEVARLRSERK